MTSQFTITPAVLEFKESIPETKTVKISWILDKNLDVVTTEASGTQFFLTHSTAPSKSPWRLSIEYDPSEGQTNTPVDLKAIAVVRIQGEPGEFKIEIPVRFHTEIGHSSLQCGVCWHQFSQTTAALKPRMMSSCGHTFCTRCLTNLMVPSVKPKKARSKSWKPDIACPVCRVVTKSQATDLKFNWTVLNTLHENADLQTPDTTIIIENPDVACVESDKHESSIYCTNCEQCYCKSCFGKCHTGKVSTTHKVIPIEDRPIPAQMCSHHPDVEAKYVCMNTTCKTCQLFCETCITREHKNHTYELLSTVLERNINLYKKNQEILNKSREELESEMCRRQEYAIKCLASHLDFMGVETRVKDHFDRLRREGVVKLYVFFETKRKSAISATNQVRKQLAELTPRLEEHKKIWKKKSDFHDGDVVRETFQKANRFTKVLPAIITPFSEYSVDDILSFQPPPPKKRRMDSQPATSSDPSTDQPVSLTS